MPVGTRVPTPDRGPLARWALGQSKLEPSGEGIAPLGSVRTRVASRELLWQEAGLEEARAAAIKPVSARRAPAPLKRLRNGSAGAILATYAASRVLVALAAVVSESLIPRNPLLQSAASGPVLSSLTTWDSGWYLGIAQNGYHVAAIGGHHDYVFFPLYPALIRLASVLDPPLTGLIAVALSNVLFLVALWLLYLLTRAVLDEDRALRACIYLSLFPFSWVFSMAYAESLFLVLSLASLLAAERGHMGWAAALAAAAGATRIQGVLLVVPLAIIAWRKVATRRTLVWLLLPVVGSAAFLVYVIALTGSALAYTTAEFDVGTSVAAGLVSDNLGRELVSGRSLRGVVAPRDPPRVRVPAGLPPPRPHPAALRRALRPEPGDHGARGPQLVRGTVRHGRISVHLAAGRPARKHVPHGMADGERGVVRDIRRDGVFRLLRPVMPCPLPARTSGAGRVMARVGYGTDR